MESTSKEATTTPMAAIAFVGQPQGEVHMRSRKQTRIPRKLIDLKWAEVEAFRIPIHQCAPVARRLPLTSGVMLVLPEESIRWDGLKAL